jgi:hypothetical protein
MRYTFTVEGVVMKLIQDFRTMLPSKVKEHLGLYFQERLDLGGVNCYNEPMYRLNDALIETRDCLGVQSDTVINCYQAACLANQRRKA